MMMVLVETLMATLLIKDDKRVWTYDEFNRFCDGGFRPEDLEAYMLREWKEIQSRKGIEGFIEGTIQGVSCLRFSVLHEPHEQEVSACGGIIDFSMPDSAWYEVPEDDGSVHRFGTTFSINGASLHLEAIEVKWVKASVGICREQVGATEDNAEIFEGVYAATGGSGPWHTITVKGKECVLIATPYCD